MVPRDRPAAKPPAHLRSTPTSHRLPWEGPPLRGILEQYRPRLGPLTEADVIALGVATVDGERAAADLPGLAFRAAPDDELLGARVLTAPLPSGRTLLLLEPSREGRLTAFLARHGEGLAALYVAGHPVPEASRPRPTGLGAEGHLVSVDGADAPVIVLVVPPLVPAGTIPP